MRDYLDEPGALQAELTLGGCAGLLAFIAKLIAPHFPAESSELLLHGRVVLKGSPRTIIVELAMLPRASSVDFYEVGILVMNTEAEGTQVQDLGVVGIIPASLRETLRTVLRDTGLIVTGKERE